MNLTLEAYQFLQRTYQQAATSATVGKRKPLRLNDLRVLALAADQFHLNETKLQENFWELFAFNPGDDFDTYFQIGPTLAADQPHYWQNKSGRYLSRGRFSHDELQTRSDIKNASLLSYNELRQLGVDPDKYTALDA